MSGGEHAGSVRGVPARAATLLAMLAAGVLAAVGPLAGAARADSIFATTGFGQWQNPVDARAAAMGDVSVVGASRFPFAPRNPAMSAFLERPAGYASVTSDFTRVDAGGGIQTRPDATLPLLAVGVPVWYGAVISASVHPLTDGRFDIRQTVAGPPAYTLHAEGEGGWTEAGIGLARRFGDLAVGVQVAFPFTALDETVTREFDVEGYIDRTEHLETDLDDAIFFTLGAHYRLGPVDVGGYVQPPSSGTVVNRREAGNVTTTRTFELGIPAAYGGGLGLHLPGGVFLAGEYRRQPWDSAEIDGESWRELPPAERTRGFKDRDAWGVGVEWQAARDAEDRPTALRWRAGYGFEPWINAGPNYGRVTDKTFTGGVGIPFREGNGELSLAFRYTLRRENTSDLEENVFGVILGIAFARQPREF